MKANKLSYHGSVRNEKILELLKIRSVEEISLCIKILNSEECLLS